MRNAAVLSLCVACSATPQTPLTYTTPEDTAVAVAVPAGATVATPAHGTIGADGTYTPHADFVGHDVMTLRTGSASSLIVVEVTAVNDAPIAVDDTLPALRIPTRFLTANDTDVDGDTLTVTAVNAATGTVEIKDDHVVYTPATGFVGVASFAYTVSDGNGATASAVATVNVVTTPDAALDQAPVAVEDSATTEEGTSVSIAVLLNDADADGGPMSVASVSQPAHGTAVVDTGGASVTYTPNSGYCHTGPNQPPDMFTYVLSPGNATGTVRVRAVCMCGQLRPSTFVVGNN